MMWIIQTLVDETPLKLKTELYVHLGVEENDTETTECHDEA